MGKGEENSEQMHQQHVNIPIGGYSTVDFEGNGYNNRSVIPPYLSNNVEHPSSAYSMAPDPPQKYENNINSDDRWSEKKPLLSTASDEVLLAVREVGEEAVEKVTLCSRLFCGVLEISCHWWVLFILFILYISLASFGLIGFFQHMRVSWEDRQQSCIAQLPTTAQECILDRIYVTPLHPEQFWWFAHTNNTAVESIKLFPDCRFIVKSGYSGRLNEIYGADLKEGSRVPCFLPKDWSNANSVKLVTGILSSKVWPSNTGKVGFEASLGVALGLLFCFSVCAWISWLVSSDCRDNCVVDLHEAGDVEPDYVALWGYPNTVYWTCNPFYCLKLCIPLTVPIKLIMNVMIVVITITVLILWGLGCSKSSSSC
eukprot:TRINITY_DN1508_c0_g1_i1.p1 TRINITY_DN1508_c0_g1~~TRINITY_DN1508_c0_g1_i1.p1  ORF type:complete len:370 (-),score=95.19 TRINITY_DN1508_c0_g1_i1:39-1148(-)